MQNSDMLPKMVVSSMKMGECGSKPDLLEMCGLIDECQVDISKRDQHSHLHTLKLLLLQSG